MARNIYSEIHLHITWHTKNSTPTITESIEPRLHRCLQGRILQAPGVLLHAIGGTDDHIHIAVTVPPSLLVSDWIGELKGASAHYINHTVANRKILEWQSGYGVSRLFIHALPDYAYLAGVVPSQDVPHARDFAARSLSISNSPWVTDDDFETICRALEAVLT